MSWKLIPIEYEGEKRIKVEFANIPALNQKIRSIQGARWSPSLRAWHVKDTAENRMQLNIFDQENAMPVQERKARIIAIQSSGVEPSIHEHLTRFIYYLRSVRYRENTIRTYREALLSFLKFWSEKPVEALTEQDVITYNNEFIIRRNLSASYQNQVVNAIKIFFLSVADRQMNLDKIHRPKRPKLYPNVLSKEEVKAILDSPRNLKHKMMLTITYACGLRCGEVINLLPTHIDSNRKMVWVKDAKGGKDRIVPISERLLEMLREYYKIYRPTRYLFEGQHKGEAYSPRSFQLVLKQAVSAAHIKKPVTLHWLRHSYATHLMDQGTDLRFIQELLGHRSSRTTEIYTHVSNRELKNIISPFDMLG